MPLIFTPGQFSQRAEFYHQLSQLTSAGIGVLHALEQLQRASPARSYRYPIRLAVQSIGQGSNLTDALREGNWLPEFDLALIDAGERSGRMDACFRLLADYYNDRARVARQVLADLAYPVALGHFAIFILPFAEFFSSGNVVRYAVKTFGILIPIYLLVALGIYAGQSKHSEIWRSLVEKILRPIPIFGKARHYLALGRLAAALEALLAAGVNIINAWELAGAACGSPTLKRTILTWKPDLLRGETPADKVNGSHLFPEMFAHLYTTGEVSGTLDDSLRKLQKYYLEEGSRKLHIFAQWLPRIIYFVVMLLIAWRVISFYMGYFNTLSNIMDGK